MCKVLLNLNSLKYIISWLKTIGLASYSLEAVLKNGLDHRSIFPKTRLIYCTALSIIFILVSYQGLQNCPIQYTNTLSKITTTLQRYCSLLLIFLTYFFNMVFRKKIVTTMKILSEVDKVLNTKSIESIQIKAKEVSMSISLMIMLMGTTVLNLLNEFNGFNSKCGLQYHLSNVVIASMTCFLVLLLMETTRRFVALNKFLTNVLKQSWDTSATYPELLLISNIHYNLCEAGRFINRYFELQILTILSISFYFFLSISFYLFSQSNILLQYHKIFYAVNALIFRMLFLWFQLWLIFHAFKRTLNEVSVLFQTYIMFIFLFLVTAYSGNIVYFKNQYNE
jgi:hypothetical protein